jgi:subtilisin-like proprotein convertase family protein
MRPEAPDDSVHADRGQTIAKPRTRKAQRSRRRRVALEALEPRTLLAVLPAPTVSFTSVGADFTATGNPPNNGHVSSPTISVNPLNSQQLAAVFTVNDPVAFGTTTPIQVRGAVSANGGASWTSFNPVSAVGGVGVEKFTTAVPPPTYGAVTDSSVAWDQTGHFFVLQDQHAADNHAGEVIVSKYILTITPGGPVATFQSATPAAQRQAWNLNGSPGPVAPGIYQPTLAVDDNVATFTDGANTQTDASAGNVYVAFIADTPPPSPAPTPWNRYTVKLLTSTDGGASFPFSANLGGGNVSFSHSAAPQIAISQGRADGKVKGGQINVVFDDYGIANTSGLDVIFTQAVNNVFTGGVLTGQAVLGAAFVTTTSTRGASGVPTGPASPTGVAAPLGFAPAPQIASDNTLGSFSQFEGRLYVVYTDRYDANRFPAFAGKNEADNTDIFMSTSDDGGKTWTGGTNAGAVQVNDDVNSLVDGFSQSTQNFLVGPIQGRPQFQPSVAVDDRTGAVAVSFYDARYDAARARVAMTLTTSIDGGNSFSQQNQSFANSPQSALDAITGQTKVLGPIPDNQSAVAGADVDATFGFGSHQSLAFLNGKLYPAWSGNFNGGGDGGNAQDLVVAQALVAAGPRIVASTMGPVGEPGDRINTLRGVDGAPIANAFQITFDRRVDPATLTMGVVTVQGRTPTGALMAVQPTVTGVTPLNANAIGATQFLVTFNSGDQVGTYSYSIAPTVSDRIRTTTTSGNTMDQNANGTAGENTASAGKNDSFSNPRPLGGVPFTGLFDSTTVPLIVTGPHVATVQTYAAPGQTPAGPLPFPETFPKATSAVLPGILNSTLVIGDPNSPDWKNVQVTSLTVDVSLTNPSDMALKLFLVAPDGTKTLLVNNRPSNPLLDGPNFTNTTFDDNGPTAAKNGLPPFTGLFRPEQPLSTFAGHLLAGAWTLEVENDSKTTQGTLNSWTLHAGSTPVALDKPISSFDVVFDRDMNLASVQAAVLSPAFSIVGPNGPVSGPFTITADPNFDPIHLDPNPAAPRTFRINFPSQMINGTYTVTLPATITSAAGTQMDANLNAGLDVLRGTDTAGGTLTTTITPSVNVPVTITPGTTSTSIITITNAAQLQSLTLQLNITYPHDPDLTAILTKIDPITGQTIINPTTNQPEQVTLFSGVGATGTGQGFSNTVFSDAGPTPIKNGGRPFSGTFTPNQPLNTAFTGDTAAGTYQLKIISVNSPGLSGPGTLNSWALTYQTLTPGTGVGHAVADRTTLQYRIFNLDPTQPISSSIWTAVGPAGIGSQGSNLNGQTAGQVSSITVDPSDPSGNTVYAGGASGGIWRTTNFLTTNPTGPTWVPLTDFGADFTANVGSIAIIPRNHDPAQSIIIVGTGEGDSLGSATQPQAARGVGFLRSMDGGQTWTLLDSTDNSMPFAAPVGAKQRDHLFALAQGTSIFKVAVDPTVEPNGEYIMYAAVSDVDGSGRAGGIWRSLDTGTTWGIFNPNLGHNVPNLAGQATDVLLDQTSGTGAPNGNLQTVYAAIDTLTQGQGVFRSPNRGQNWVQMVGGIGDPLIQNADSPQPQPVGVTNGATPVGASGRVVLARPAPVPNQPLSSLENKLYQGWLFAAVTTPATVNFNGVPQGGQLVGLFVTKDFGQNWTQVQLPEDTFFNPTNDLTQARVDPTGHQTLTQTQFGLGVFNLALAVDPTNPNILYLGGTNQYQATGLIRIDITGIADPHAFYLSNSEADGGLTMTSTNGPVSEATPTTPPPPFVPPYSPFADPFLNFVVDPASQFSVNSTLLVTNTARFNNTGGDVKWVPFDKALAPDPYGLRGSNQPTRGLHQIVTLIDPLTGKTRLIFGDDQGVYTAVDANDADAVGGQQNDGALLGSVGGLTLGAPGASDTPFGSTRIVNGSRNGNLQIAQMYSAAAQPSTLAAQSASLPGALYGATNGVGMPQSNVNEVNSSQPGLGYGSLSWVGGIDRYSGAVVATDPTGSGKVYQYILPSTLADEIHDLKASQGVTDFFQVNGVSQTFGLVLQANGGDIPDPQWPFNTGSNFTVNPINGQQILISSQTGTIFRTENGGNSWAIIGAQGDLDNPAKYAPALAFGAPDPNGPGGIGNLDNFLYAGTTNGSIFVTQTGGGTIGGGNAWTNISNGLDGSSVAAIVANPTRGSHEAYAVTSGGNSLTFNNDTSGPFGIPDKGTVTSTTTINQDLYIGKLTVTVTLAHTIDSSLTLTLTAPDGTKIVLADGVNGVNFNNTTFDDQAITPIISGASPFSGSFAPMMKGTQGGFVHSYLSSHQNLAIDVYGYDARGVWTLSVTDNVQDNVTGALANWSMNVTTLGGVYHNADSTAGAGWQAIAGVSSNTLYRITADGFGQTGQAQQTDALVRSLSSIVADWRYAIPDSFTNPSSTTHPMLYVAGQGGVLRSIDDGLNWAPFPSADPTSLTSTPNPPGNGGGMPVSSVTSLSIAAGNIDVNTGRPLPQAGDPNLLLASTYGRGAFGIRLSPDVFSSSLKIDPSTPNTPGGSDSGNTVADRQDHITNVNTPTIDGFSEQSAFGSTVFITLFDVTNPANPIYIGGFNPLIPGTAVLANETDPNGKFAVTVTVPLADGPHRIGVQATDQSGTRGNIALLGGSNSVLFPAAPAGQPPFSIVIDTTPPAVLAAPDLEAASDSGRFNNDDDTNVTNPIFDVINVEPQAELQLFRDGLLVNTLFDVAGGTIAIQDPGPVSGGVHVYKVIQIDVAANSATSQSPGLTVTIDTTPPAAPNPPALEPGSNTGIIPGNNHTSNNKPFFDVSVISETFETVQLLRNGVVVNTVLLGVAPPVNGIVAIQDPGPVPDGVYTYTAVQIDVAANKSVASGPTTVTIDTIAPAAPATPALSPTAPAPGGSDSGVLGDNTTNVTSPFFNVGNIEVSGTVELFRDGVLVNTLNVTAGGTVSIQDPGPVAAGVYVYTADQIDLANNKSVKSQGATITIITAAPPAPGVPVLLPSSDSGISNNDDITNVTHPVFAIAPAQANATVQLLRKPLGAPNSAYVVVGATSPSGPGNVQDNGPGGTGVPQGVYEYASRQIDVAANVGPISASLVVTIDTTAPVAPAKPTLQLVSDSGRSNSDAITNVTNPTFNVTGVEASATLQLFRNGALVNTLNFTAGGVVAIQDPGPAQPDGVYVYTAQQTDLAGNISLISGSISVTVLTVPPVAPPAPVLDPASDSGPRDNITKVGQPFFNVTATPPTIVGGPANFVQLLRKLDPTGNGAFDPNPANYVVVGQSLGTGQVQDGTSVALADGTYDYVTRQVDVAGNIGALSGRDIVTIVTAPPPAPTTLVLDPASDSGISNSDDLTSATIIHFPIFDVSGVEQGATLKLFRNGVLVNTLVTAPQAPGAPLTFISVQINDPKQPFSDGAYTYTVQQIDQAGNVGAVSPPLLVTFDNTPPIAPRAPVLEASSDTGISNSDNITNSKHPVFDVANVEPNATLQLLRNGQVVATLNFTPGGTVPIQDNGPGGAGVSDGVYIYQAIQTDVAGNISPLSGSLTVTIHTVPPASPPPTPDLEAASDSGASNSDNITNVISPTIDVVAVDPNVLVQLLRNGAVVGTRTGSGPITDAGPVQPDAVYTYTAREVDLAGNIGPSSAALLVTIATSAPAPSTPILDPNSDTGVLGDNITSATQPVFDINTALPGATVRLLRNNAIVGTRTGPGTIQDSGAPGNGVPTGVWNYQAIQIDLAGNISPLSGTDQVTIIASAAAPGAPILEPASDSGSSNSDNITNVTRPIFDVAPAGATSTVNLVRKPLGAPDSAYVIAATRIGPGALTDNGPVNAGVPDGTYIYAAQQIDLANNVSPRSGTLQVVIVTSEPAPNAPVLQSTNTNGVTNVNKPVFNLTGVTAVATVTLLRKPIGAPDSAYASVGTRVGPGVVTDNGPGNNGLADGGYVYAAKQSDPAGNNSPLSLSTAVTILTTAPAAPPAPTLHPGSDSGGNAAAQHDGITNHNKPIFDVSAGAAANIATIQLLRKAAGASNATYIVVGALTTGVSSGPITDPTPDTGNAVPDGSYTYAVRLIDQAGNMSAIGGTLAVTIDTIAPAAPTIALDPSTGVGTHGNITGNTRPIFAGTAERGSVVELLQTINGTPTVVKSAIASPANGTYTIQVPLPFGSSTVAVRATDVAGNVGTPGAALTIHIAANPGDFDGDGKTDTAIYDQTSSQFFVLLSGGSALTPQFGNPAHVNIPVAGDFNGDGKDDTAIYDQTSSQYYVLFSGVTPPNGLSKQFGNPAHINIPIGGDFDGDGKTDTAIYDQTSSQFFVLLSGGSALTPQFGNPADVNIPLAGDFDGDGKTDIGIYDQTKRQFFILLSSGGALTPTAGNLGDVNITAAGDFNGDGRTDIAVYDQTKSQFLISLSGGGSLTPQFGNPAHSNIPLSGDYNGDGKTDVGIYDQTTSQFLIMLSGGGVLTPQFGNPAHFNIALPAVYLPKLAGRSAVLTRSSGGGAGSFDIAGAASAFAVGSPSTTKPAAGAAKSLVAASPSSSTARSRQVLQVSNAITSTVVSHDHKHHDAALEHLHKSAIHGRRRPR